MSWLRSLRSLFPFSEDGRQTLIYLSFALAGPALTILLYWALTEMLARPGLWSTFANVVLYIVGPALLIAVCGLAMFVSIRSVKMGSFFEAGSWRGPEDREP